jgi:hypothetical protein
VNSPVFNAGAEGLTLVAHVYVAEDRDAAWLAHIDAGIVVVELDSGDYYVTGLPEGESRQRFHLVVVASGSPSIGLYGYGWGAVPGERIVYRVATEIPDSPREFRQGDTHGSIALVVTSGLPDAISNPLTEVTWSQSSKDSDAVLTARPATVGSIVADDLTGTKGATFAYEIEADTLDETGLHFGVFVVTYPDGTVQTIPAENILTFNVLPTIVEPEP